MRAAWVRAAATEICWPSTTRIAKLALVDCPGDAPPRRLGDQFGQRGVLPELVGHRFGISVEIEQPSTSGHRRGEVAEVVENEAAGHVVRTRGETDDGIAVGEP